MEWVEPTARAKRWRAGEFRLFVTFLDWEGRKGKKEEGEGGSKGGRG